MRKILLLVVLLMSPMSLVSGAEPESEYIAHTKVELVSDAKNLEPGHPFRLAVRFFMEKDWHVYWKNPGDSGLAPTIDWTLPPGVTVGDIHWPTPTRIIVDPLASYGYENEVYLIFDANLPKDWPVNAPLEVNAKIDWLACKVECIPGSVKRQLSIPIRPSPMELNVEVAQRLDQESRRWPVAVKDITVEADERGNVIELKIRSAKGPPLSNDLYFFPERGDLIDHAAQQSVSVEDGHVRLTIPKSDISAAGKVDRLQGILVNYGGENSASLETQGIIIDVPLAHPPAASGPPSQATMTLFAACLFAFLGGMILNLMPCVLPVLSLKVLALVKHAHNRRTMITHGLLFSFGILTAFWVLTATLLLLKSAGHQIGWGFQFQSPYFVVSMATLLFVLALNLLGVFEFVPVALSNADFRDNPYGNSFFNGILATTLATPCTTPFMGAALGYALTQPNLIAVLIFTFLGMGMAFPYFFLCVFPQFLKWVPKPGAWMNNLKVFLGFVLMGSVVWLVKVLGVQNGVDSVAALLFGLVFVSLCGWVYGLIENESFSLTKLSWLILSGVLAFGLLYASASMQGLASQERVPESKGSISWQKYSPELLKDLLAQKKPVFIDFTAAWCLTCQVNDRLVFENKKVQQGFQELSIVTLKADWTNKDPQIARALEGYGKNSIPLYVYYPAGSQTPDIWPELITPEAALQRLRGRPRKND